MGIQWHGGGSHVSTLVLTGSLDFSLHPEMMVCLREFSDKQGSELKVDVSKVSRMDTAGLGMLLMLRSKAERLDMIFRLEGACEKKHAVLFHGGFHHFFQLSVPVAQPVS